LFTFGEGWTAEAVGTEILLTAGQTERAVAASEARIAFARKSALRILTPTMLGARSIQQTLIDIFLTVAPLPSRLASTLMSIPQVSASAMETRRRFALVNFRFAVFPLESGLTHADITSRILIGEGPIQSQKGPINMQGYVGSLITGGVILAGRTGLGALVNVHFAVFAEIAVKAPTPVVFSNIFATAIVLAGRGSTVVDFRFAKSSGKSGLNAVTGEAGREKL
jgi:hypothetical protein